MELYTIVGFSERAGNYEGTAYHNIYLYATYAEDNTIGLQVETVKIKAEDCKDVFGFELTKQKSESLLGKTFNVFYDKFGRVVSINIK